ncbi:hypothetical protein llap_15126 [Limosa lapponica baueri]|uniref:Rna-directed dna polymerase from mobile element jockey-like n=1 Tax=Limosa lapponica baueri TaxID=1758121 RepID=A0A2I0TL68_LIMLA|nr:hypothetical protein llap_15126 [Limosa lapponica baueri]
MVRDLLHHLDTHKSMEPDGIHLRVPRELVEVLTEPLSIIYQQSWLTREVPVDWHLANVMPIHKKGRKEDPGNYRPVCLTSVPGKVMEQIILSVITRHVKDNQVTCLVDVLVLAWDTDGREAKQLAPLARESGIDRALGRPPQSLTLWRRLLLSMRSRYPYRDDITYHPSKWTTIERSVKNLREIAVREMLFTDLDNPQTPLDPKLPDPFGAGVSALEKSFDKASISVEEKPFDRSVVVLGKVLDKWCKKSRLAWRSQDLLVKLKGKKEMHAQWKQVEVSWEDRRDTARLCRDGVRKAKAQLEHNLMRDAKNNKKGIYRYVNQKRPVKESIPVMMNMTGKLVITDKEKAEVLNNFFASVFTGNLSPRTY